MGKRRKVALITGASSGIGAGTSVYFATKGYKLALNGRNMERLEAVAKRCRKACSSSKHVILVPGDVRDEDVIKSAVKETVAKFGQLDLLVNNAGTTVYKSFMDTSVDDLKFLLDINVKSVAMWTKEAAPHLSKSKGNVVNVSSISAFVPGTEMPLYCVSKAAQDMLTRCLAVEMGPMGVRVNSVNPGHVVTNINESAGLTKEEYKQFLDHVKSFLPLGRIGEVEDVASAIYYLASDEARYMTGSHIKMDGGESSVVGCST